MNTLPVTPEAPVGRPRRLAGPDLTEGEPSTLAEAVRLLDRFERLDEKSAPGTSRVDIDQHAYAAMRIDMAPCKRSWTPSPIRRAVPRSPFFPMAANIRYAN